MENAKAIEITSGPARNLALRILEGWEPTAPPQELKVKRFRWGDGLPPSAVALRLTVEGAMLTVHCGVTSVDEMLEAALAGKLRNQPCEGDAADDFIFRAQHSYVRQWTIGEYPFRCVNWRLEKRGAKPVIWVGWFEEAPKLHVRNLTAYFGDWGSTQGLRLEGRYRHYLLEWRNGRVWYIVEPQEGAPLDGEVFNREMHALQFTLGRPLNVEMLYGIDSAGDVVAYAGMPFSFGGMPRHGADWSPVWNRMEHASTAAFFSALCAERDEADDDLLRRCIGYYVHSLGGYVEVQGLQLNIAVEAIARYLWLKEAKKEPKMYRSRHAEWLDWCGKHEQEIKGVAIPGKEESLYQSVRRADAAGASAIVGELCARLGLNVDDVMKNALESRHNVAHDGSLPFTDDIDQDVILIDAPRTLLIALVAKMIGYQGPIRGYHSRANPVSPPWWTEGELPPSAHHIYLFTSRIEPGDLDGSPVDADSGS